jgi:hypothetical protein
VATVEQVIQARLAAYSGLTALTSAIYWGEAPQKTAPPYVVHGEISQITRPNCMGSDPGDVVSRWQVSVFAVSMDSAKDVGEQVRAALQRYRAVVAGVTVDDCMLIGRQGPFRDEEPNVFHLAQDFALYHREA